jgi:hypothetical protein
MTVPLRRAKPLLFQGCDGIRALDKSVTTVGRSSNVRHLTKAPENRVLIVVIAFILSACAVSGAPALPPEPTGLVTVPDGPVGDLQGVLVQRTTHYETGNSNDSIPDFDRQLYDTDGAWSPEQPDRIVIPEGWETVIVTVRGAWAGHVDRWVELKLYRNAERPIGNDQEDRLVAVVQIPTNPDSPFLELTTPPLPVEAGDEFLIAFKTPKDRTLIAYGEASVLFGAYVP